MLSQVQWWKQHPHRALANNSVSYTEKPDIETFMREWTALVESKSGERGIFNREASKKQAEKYGRRDPNYEFGTNPCSEIILRPYQFCNLTEVVVRATDTRWKISSVKSSWLRFLALFNLPSPDFHIYGKSGKETQKKKDS